MAFSHSFTLLTCTRSFFSLTMVAFVFSVKPSISSNGMRLAFLTEGVLGVDGSPGPSERNWTLPRWSAEPGRYGPFG